MRKKLNILGVSLLEERRPELVPAVTVHVDEAVVLGGESVIYAHLHPLTILPELEPKHTCSTKQTCCKGELLKI